MGVVVHPFDPRVAKAWDEFVTGAPDGTFFHLATWQRVIEAAFGHRTHYAFATRDGAITGVLPLVHMRTILFGNTLVSTPFCVYGGPLTTDSESAAALESHAVSLLGQTDAAAVEFRYRTPMFHSDWASRAALYETFRKPIKTEAEQNMQAIPRKQRAMVRKGIQNGLVSKVNQDARTLHRIYADSLRNLGTPVFSLRYFRLLLEAFADQCSVLTVLDQHRPIASVLNFYFRDEVLPYYGGGTKDARVRAGNDFMYWEVMRRAAASGCHIFDFGRSKIGTGAHAFKRNWGFAPVPLDYRYMLGAGRKMRDNNPLNPKFGLLIAAWKRLPLPIANAIGPRLVRGLG